MAQDKSMELRVGALVFVCTALLFGFVWILGDFGGGHDFVVYVDYPTASDLKVGAPIKVAGVSAGKVKAVDYWGGRKDDDVGRHVTVRVTLGFEEGIGPTLHRDARFYISTLGMLGEKYVEVDPGSPASPGLTSGAKMVGMPPLRMEILAQQLTKVAGVVTRILETNEDHLAGLLQHADETLVAARKTVIDVDGVVVENRDAVKTVLGRLDHTGAKVDRLIDSARHAIGDGGGVKRSIDNMESLTGTLRREAGPLMSDARRTAAEARAAATRLRKGPMAAVLLGEKQHRQIGSAIAKAEGAVGDVKAMTGRVRDGKGTLGGVVADNELFMDIKLLVKDLKRHPWKFIWRQ